MAQKVAQLKVLFTEGGQPMANSYHVSIAEGSFSNVALATILTAIDGQLRSVYKGLIPTSDSLDAMELIEEQNPLDPTAARAFALLPINQAGTRIVGDGDLPKAACTLLQLRTDLYGRSFKGRVFLPPIVAKSQVDSGHVTGSGEYMLAVQALRTKLIDGFSGGAWWTDTSWNAGLAVYSKTLRARGADNWWASVTTINVPTRIHWLRSRQA